jgi:pSer/pThr/pTyr-binding forkhead associated (FHA) protein
VKTKRRSKGTARPLAMRDSDVGFTTKLVVRKGAGIKGPRDLIIEDLNSTNGVIVNGRKVSRLLLSDGDVVTIGETQFRCSLNPAKRQPEAPPETPSAGPQSAES